MGQKVRQVSRFSLKASALLLLLPVLIPPAASANVALPLMFYSQMFHLVFGNIVLGVVEGLALAQFLKVSRLRCIGFMILANYLSCGVGLLVLPFLRAGLAPRLSLSGASFAAMGLLLVLTIVTEYPFLFLIWDRTRKTFHQAIKAFVAVQAVSTFCVLLLYHLLTSTAMIQDMELVALENFPIQEPVRIYYIGEDNESVYCIKGAAPPQVVCSLQLEDKWLGVERENGVYWNLCISEGPVILRNIADESIQHFGRAEYLHTVHWWGPVQVGDPDSHHYSFNSIPYLGLEGSREPANPNAEKIMLTSVRTILETWPIQFVNHLPGDQLVFCVGLQTLVGSIFGTVCEERIYLADPVHKKIAFVAKGRSPVAILEAAVPTENGAS